MLVKSFRLADHEWAINESLIATGTICYSKAGCSALVRHGMLEVVQKFLEDTHASSLAAQTDSTQLSRDANALCAYFLCALAKCDATRHTLSLRPRTVLVIIRALR